MPSLGHFFTPMVPYSWMSLHFGQRYLYVFFWLADAVFAITRESEDPARDSAAKKARRRMGLLMVAPSVCRAKARTYSAYTPSH